MAATHTFIDKVLLTGTQSSVTFSNIPSTYTDLKIVFSAVTNRTGTNYTDDIFMEFNGLTTNLISRLVYGGQGTTGSVTNATTAWAGYGTGSSGTADTYGNSEVYIFGYAGSLNKTILVDGVPEANSANGVYIAYGQSVWNSTSPITSILLRPGSGTAFNAGSNFYLYGIKNS